MLPTAALDFQLPPGLIATKPAQPRDAARLLAVSRSDESLLHHRRFADLPEYLSRGDLLLLNATSVLPARITGRRTDSGGRVSGLFHVEQDASCWHVLLRSNGRLFPGVVIRLTDLSGRESPYTIELLERSGDGWSVRPGSDRPGEVLHAALVLEHVGATPLPPYILGARKERRGAPDDPHDREWYQTVYARPKAAASVAAPTAGLHFTPELLGAIDRRGVRREDVLLDIGAGTFKPVSAEYVEQHDIHAERYHVPASTSAAIAQTRADHGRIFAVGTTTVRAIESVPPDTPAGDDYSGETRLLITPGYRFRTVDGLITNFHLPRSTLLALVAAMLPGGVDRLREIYSEAIGLEYRFFSYGDAMLILP